MVLDWVGMQEPPCSVPSRPSPDAAAPAAAASDTGVPHEVIMLDQRKAVDRHSRQPAGHSLHLHMQQRDRQGEV
jgi:hypothetical protein